jgi:ectoine hydroxylase-related dioxygenase (phytanoyl-CoA dioxygenase family)
MRWKNCRIVQVREFCAMTPEDVLSIEPKILTHKQRESYFADGYLLVERAISEKWLERLRGATNEMIEESRGITKSDAVWDLEAGHSAEAPRLRRLSSPNDKHPTYWEFASRSVIPDIIADLVGPNVKFHHSKLNFKWAHGGEEVKWHQDIGFWPHTNYSPCTVGAYIYNCGMDQGPLGVIRGSHDGPLYDQYAKGTWTGCLSEADAAAIDPSRIVFLDGPAGSITIHNCRTIHGSKPNTSNLGRPLLLNVYASADAFPYTHNPIYSKYDQQIVRGEQVHWAHHDPRPCLVPPDWSGGYTSIFALQRAEGKTAAE